MTTADSEFAIDQSSAIKIRSDINKNQINNMNININERKENQHHISIDSNLSLFERIRQFLYINFLLNKYSFILAILSFLADLILFISLNLYLFTNKSLLYEINLNNISQSKQNSVVETQSLFNDLLRTNTSNQQELNDIIGNSSDTYLTIFNQNKSSIEKLPKTIKQSYLSLQIIIIFVFFICFILSYLIKLQFKYHRLAINLYDYDIEAVNQQDRDGLDSLASTTTASHFSSSINKKFSSLLKRLLNRIFTKLADILLNFTFGYQFSQNCFIELPEEIAQNGFSIFIHIFILTCVIFKCMVLFLSKKNSMNQLSHLKNLQTKQKTFFDTNKNIDKNYYFYYYSYFIRYNQNQFNQLKQHQNNQNTFRIFQLNDISLFIGFLFGLFHLFNFLKTIELIFVFLPILFTLILFRLKSIFNAVLNLSFIFLSIMIISSYSSFNSIKEIGDYLKKNESIFLSNENMAKTNNQTSNIIDYTKIKGSTSIIDIFSYNLLTFLGFMLLFYFKSIQSIHYCSLTSLERWNISFLCNFSIFRKLSIYFSFIIYLFFTITCSITLCIRLKKWSFLLLPFYFLVILVWCSFQLLNIINLTHLMNKISDCFLLLNESNSINSNINSFENSSNISKKPKSSHFVYSQNNRNSNLSQLSTNNQTNLNNNNNNSNNNNNNNNNNNFPSSSFKFSKFISRFLSYNKLNMYEDFESKYANSINIPIHRILGYKGVRHLGSISYRISIYCFVQTCILSLFAYNTSSPLTIGLYLITLSLNLIWLSLLYQFPKSATGNCIAYALVAPPLILNIYNAGTLGTNSTLFSSLNPTLSNTSKKYKTASSTSSSTGTCVTFSSNSTYSDTNTASGNSLLFLPLNYQQALTQRCTFILNKFYSFLQFHLIENYGCDFASTGLNKEFLEIKLKSYFQKKSTDGQYYNTYILYYCGPTSAQTDNISFIDGNEFSIEQIIEFWKEIHCKSSLHNQEIQENDSFQQTEIKKKQETCIKKNSRLIIILDAENTAKSLQYIKSKLNQDNIYVALQTVKYNYSSNTKYPICKGFENKLTLNERKDYFGGQKLMGPGSPQTMSWSFFDSYLNIGKFTLDWIKSNCNSFNMTNYEKNEFESYNNLEDFLINNKLNDFTEDKENFERENNDEDDEDDYEDDNESIEYDLNKNEPDKETIKKSKHSNSTFFYETKCAFSRYWTDYTFDSNVQTLSNDFNQFWNLYYPYVICKPMLKLINCRLFYLRLEFFKNLIFYLKRWKNRIIPIHEYDTGHGFKLFSS